MAVKCFLLKRGKQTNVRLADENIGAKTKEELQKDWYTWRSWT